MTLDTIDLLAISADKTEKTNGGLILTGPRVTINLPAAPAMYLYSGWQSWSLTAWVDTHYHLRPARPASLLPMQVDPVYAKDSRPNGSWYGAIKTPAGQVFFLGALGLDAHVALEGTAFQGWYESGSGDWFVAAGDEPEFLSRYASLLGQRFGTGRRKSPQRVWCSWYSLYTAIDETRLHKVLSDLEDLPFDVFQVDDGWQINIGDWEPNSKFPSGMDDLASRVINTHRKAGLWLAPLLVAPSSKTFNQHPDWLLRDQNGKLVSAGFNWGEQLYALDTTHPAALEWLTTLMKQVRQWGYDYIKLDFLYAGALPGKRYLNMPREAAYRNGLKALRQALGDAYFLTCGAPVLPSIGLCDAMRVGPDVAAHFCSHRDDDLLLNFATPGLRNALRTTLHRLWLSPLLHTDPDVVYFRNRQNSLSKEHKLLFKELALICNFKATSDIPTWLTDLERQELHRFLEASPHIQKTGPHAFMIDDHQVDFSPFIDLPPKPGSFTNMQGVLLGWLANIPLLMKLFTKLSDYSLRKMVIKNPV